MSKLTGASGRSRPTPVSVESCSSKRFTHCHSKCCRAQKVIQNLEKIRGGNSKSCTDRSRGVRLLSLESVRGLH